MNPNCVIAFMLLVFLLVFVFVVDGVKINNFIDGFTTKNKEHFDDYGINVKGCVSPTHPVDTADARTYYTKYCKTCNDGKTPYYTGAWWGVGDDNPQTQAEGICTNILPPGGDWYKNVDKMTSFKYCQSRRSGNLECGTNSDGMKVPEGKPAQLQYMKNGVLSDQIFYSPLEKLTFDSNDNLVTTTNPNLYPLPGGDWYESVREGECKNINVQLSNDPTNKKLYLIEALISTDSTKSSSSLQTTLFNEGDQFTVKDGKFLLEYANPDPPPLPTTTPTTPSTTTTTTTTTTPSTTTTRKPFNLPFKNGSIISIKSDYNLDGFTAEENPYHVVAVSYKDKTKLNLIPLQLNDTEKFRVYVDTLDNGIQTLQLNTMDNESIVVDDNNNLVVKDSSTHNSTKFIIEKSNIGNDNFFNLKAENNNKYLTSYNGPDPITADREVVKEYEHFTINEENIPQLINPKTVDGYICKIGAGKEGASTSTKNGTQSVDDCAAYCDRDETCNYFDFDTDKLDNTNNYCRLYTEDSYSDIRTLDEILYYKNANVCQKNPVTTASTTTTTTQPDFKAIEDDPLLAMRTIDREIKIVRINTNIDKNNNTPTGEKLYSFNNNGKINVSNIDSKVVSCAFFFMTNNTPIVPNKTQILANSEFWRIDIKGNILRFIMGGNLLESTVKIVSNTLYHCVVTIGNDELNLYVDGNQTTLRVNVPSNHITKNITFGVGNASSNISNFNGTIAIEVPDIQRRVLSKDLICDTYQYCLAKETKFIPSGKSLIECIEKANTSLMCNELENEDDKTKCQIQAQNDCYNCNNSNNCLWIDEEDVDISQESNYSTVPSKPNIRCTAFDSKIVVDWVEPDNGGSVILSYMLILYETENKEKGIKFLQMSNPNTGICEYPITNLKNQVTYDIYVVAINKQGMSDLSNLGTSTPNGPIRSTDISDMLLPSDDDIHRQAFEEMEKEKDFIQCDTYLGSEKDGHILNQVGRMGFANSIRQSYSERLNDLQQQIINKLDW